MFVLRMSCIDFNTAMYLLPVEVLKLSTNFYACAASVAYIDATPLDGPLYRPTEDVPTNSSRIRGMCHRLCPQLRKFLLAESFLVSNSPPACLLFGGILFVHCDQLFWRQSGDAL